MSTSVFFFLVDHGDKCTLETNTDHLALCACRVAFGRVVLPTPKTCVRRMNQLQWDIA